MKLLFGLLLLACISCNKGASTPEGLIKMFVKDSVSSSLDREYFETYTTGSLLNSIADLSDEELEKSELSALSGVKVDILTKSCQSDICNITYIVSYDTNSDTKKSFETEVKKLAEVQKVGENWKIASIKNLKTFHESLVPINPLQDK